MGLPVCTLLPGPPHQRSSDLFTSCVASIAPLSMQVAEHRLPKAFDYHRTPAPFIQVCPAATTLCLTRVHGLMTAWMTGCLNGLRTCRSSCWKILAFMGAGDKAASENMYAVIGDAMRRANTGHTIGNAIIYECVRTIHVHLPQPSPASKQVRPHRHANADQGRHHEWTLQASEASGASKPLLQCCRLFRGMQQEGLSTPLAPAPS